MTIKFFSITYDAPNELNPNIDFFEQNIYALLLYYGFATINEQDNTTLDGKDLSDDKKRLIVYFDENQTIQTPELSAQIQQCARQFEIEIQLSFDELNSDDWQHAWKAYFKPQQISKHIAVTPPWEEFPAKPNLHTIVIEPGLAFGTGLHETTRLCIEELDNYTQNHTPTSLLDLGCGTSILAIAAKKLGFQTIYATDNDPIAIDVSRENAEINNTNDITFSTLSPKELKIQVDCIVANIISSTLMQLKDEIINAAISGATIILSGILAAEADEFITNFSSPQLNFQNKRQMGEWTAIIFQKI